ncbi:hypothetical protein ACSTIE_23560, partial [Vibrio parahaemolyticus]
RQFDHYVLDSCLGSLPNAVWITWNAHPNRQIRLTIPDKRVVSVDLPCLGPSGERGYGDSEADKSPDKAYHEAKTT